MVVDGATGGAKKQVEEVACGNDAYFFVSFSSEVADDFIDSRLSFFCGQHVPVSFDLAHTK